MLCLCYVNETITQKCHGRLSGQGVVTVNGNEIVLEQPPQRLGSIPLLTACIMQPLHNQYVNSIT